VKEADVSVKFTATGYNTTYIQVRGRSKRQPRRQTEKERGGENMPNMPRRTHNKNPRPRTNNNKR
jgi:hypothetical protein